MKQLAFLIKATLIVTCTSFIPLIAVPAYASNMPLATSPYFIPVSINGGLLINQGGIIGKPFFPMGDNITGGRGQTIDGIKANSMEALAYHIHAHLSIIDKGHEIAIPAGIGITPPLQIQNGFVSNGAAYYWLHTHDATGIIHIESPVHKIFTLGQFFDIWGMPLSKNNVAGFKGKVLVYVNGKPDYEPLRMITLTAHKQITLEIGKPYIKPPKYIFPQGL